MGQAHSLVAIACLGAAACAVELPPVVTIVSPGDNVVISDFEPASVEARVVLDEGAELDAVVLLIDGEVAAELNPVELPSASECREGCLVSFELFTADLAETEHRVAVRAVDDRGEVGGDVIDVSLVDTPALTISSPGDGEDLAGVGQVAVSISVVDRSPLAMAMSIDGEPVGEIPAETSRPCGSGCSIAYAWETGSLAEGTHTIDVAVSDPFGREASASATVDLADVVYVSAIEVTDERDGGDRLEVEVHLFEAETNIQLGCSGQDNGLEDVDGSDVRYQVLGLFDDTASPGPLRLSSIADRDVVVRVIEDDANRCPAPPGGSDDSIGTSAPLAGAAIPTEPPMQFDAVVHLDLDAGRPLSR